MTLSTTETAKTNALEMFRMGNDYIQIGNLLRMTEAEVEKEVHRLRSDERLYSQSAEYREKRKEKVKEYKRAYMRRQREAMREARAQL